MKLVVAGERVIFKTGRTKLNQFGIKILNTFVLNNSPQNSLIAFLDYIQLQNRLFNTLERKVEQRSMIQFYIE